MSSAVLMPISKFLRKSVIYKRIPQGFGSVKG